MSNETYKEYGYNGNGETEDLLRWALEKYQNKIAIACSFQHTVLIDMAVKINPNVKVFSIDTCRLPEETYECASDIENHFGIKIEWFLPQQDSVERMMQEDGPLAFKESLEARHRCCAVRKVEPLKRALNGLDAWITGVRREQNPTRTGTSKIERDDIHDGIIKINPLADWTYEDIKSYVKEHRLPYNTLFEKGFTSIGCAPCTRSIEQGENARAGRWWWEDEKNKECGLHVRNWNI